MNRERTNEDYPIPRSVRKTRTGRVCVCVNVRGRDICFVKVSSIAYESDTLIKHNTPILTR